MELRSSESAQIAVKANLLDAAARRTRMGKGRIGITRAEIAYLVGKSESLVDKWMCETEPASPSFLQLLMLPPQFWLALLAVLDEHCERDRESVEALNEIRSLLKAVLTR